MHDEARKISLYTNVQIETAIPVSTAPSTDEQLVAAVLDGDETAFEAIFDRHKRTITKVVGRFFRDRSEIEEAVQQTFTKIYFSLRKFRGGEDLSFSAWGMRIAVNVCYDEFRRRQRHGENLFSEISDEENDVLFAIADGREISPENRAMNAQLAKKILAGLDAEDRIAVSMVYSEEYSLDEVANAIGITKSSLKSRLFRCRNQLKARFGYLFS
jgi:RNA polymerase sigma factor (sigma-70 family)